MVFWQVQTDEQSREQDTQWAHNEDTKSHADGLFCAAPVFA